MSPHLMGASCARIAPRFFLSLTAWDPPDWNRSNFTVSQLHRQLRSLRRTAIVPSTSSEKATNSSFFILPLLLRLLLHLLFLYIVFCVQASLCSAMSTRVRLLLRVRTRVRIASKAQNRSPQPAWDLRRFLRRVQRALGLQSNTESF